MVALDDEGWNALAIEPPEFAREKQAGRHILPVAVENIAANRQEGGLRGDGLLDQRLDGASPGPRETRRNRLVLAAKTGERAIDMQIGGVHEGEAHEGPKTKEAASRGTR